MFFRSATHFATNYVYGPIKNGAKFASYFFSAGFALGGASTFIYYRAQDPRWTCLPDVIKKLCEENHCQFIEGVKYLTSSLAECRTDQGARDTEKEKTIDKQASQMCPTFAEHDAITLNVAICVTIGLAAFTGLGFCIGFGLEIAKIRRQHQEEKESTQAAVGSYEPPAVQLVTVGSGSSSRIFQIKKVSVQNNMFATVLLVDNEEQPGAAPVVVQGRR